MSRLDSHIGTIRNRMALGLFLSALAWAGMALGAAIVIALVAERVMDRTLGHGLMLIGAGLAVALVASLIYSASRRPSARTAAMKIDEVLELKEKYSTALYARTMDDPFAHAAVLDAEWSSGNVSLYKRFPLRFPREFVGTAGVFFLALMVAEFMPAFNWFAKPPVPPQANANTVALTHSDQFVKQALPTILAPATMPSAGEAIKRATDDLNKALHTDEGDELRNHRSVLSALQDYNKTIVEELNKNEKFQTAMEEQNQMASIAPAQDDSTPMGKAQNDLKSGDMNAAMNDVSAAVDKFDKMTDAEKQKVIAQAKSFAQELANAANDPHANEKIAQQLMQMGASQSQAQQMAATMQQAAQGNKQAQQQLQQMARQIAQQMNNGQGPSKQQQQQMQQMMTKAQAVANTQAQAQALSNAAQQLGIAMIQARAAAGQHSSSPGQQSGKPGQGQSGSQSGQSQGQSGMAQAQKNMQQQLQQMQANAQDAQSMQAAANAAAEAAADAAAGLNGSSGNSDGELDNGSATGNNPMPGGNPGGNNAQWSQTPGKGGTKMGIAMAPATFKQELDPSKDIQSGKILASRYVKAGIDPGQSTAGLKEAAASAEKDAEDDIDQDHVPRDAQRAEKDYFSAMQDQGN